MPAGISPSTAPVPGDAASDGARALRILHMASCARSGETLMLRILNSHPHVHVPFDLAPTNDRQERQALAFFRDCAEKSVPADHPALGGRVPEGCRAVVVKQGVWRHATPFDGFVLARNPVSVIASLLRYDRQPAAQVAALEALGGLGRRLGVKIGPLGRMHPRWARLLRWQRNMDPALTPFLERASYLEALCSFYTARMLDLVATGLPVVHYEKLVADPARELSRLTGLLGLDNDPTLLASHRDFDPGATGHGGIDLSRPIDARSLTAYQRTVGPAQFARIAALTYPAWSALGYEMAYGAIRVKDGPGPS